MRKQILISLFIIISNNLYCQVKKSISLSESSVNWIGEKITGGQHDGTVNLLNGNFIFKNNILIGGEFTIDMNTITCLDIENPKYANKLVAHLKDEDFFATNKFPTSSFVISNVVYDGQSYMITGDITIRGLSQEITFSTDFHNDEKKFIADATIAIDRTKHDVKHRSKYFFDDLGDRIINDEFIIKVHLETIK